MILESKRPTTLNVSDIPKRQTSPATGRGDRSPLTIRRKRTKMDTTGSKTNEQLIQQSHEMLMQYVDNLDNQVKQVLDNHEAQFLTAYRKHSSKVKEQMKQIKHQMLANTQNEKNYLDRIKYLEKQLIVFREETLKMSEKVISKSEDIQNLKIKLKEVLFENKQQKNSIAELTKTKMCLSARLQKQQNTNTNGVSMQLEGQQQNKFTYISQIPNEQPKINNKLNPLSHLKSQTAQLRTRSIRNKQKNTINLISSTIQQNFNELITPQSNQKDSNFNQKMNSIRTDLSNDRKKQKSIKVKFERNKLIEAEIYKLKSKSFAQRNQYEKIFIDCVEIVRKNIMKKEFAESLNYFKQNGPKNLIEFKKLDYFLLLELFLEKDAISKKLYELTFQHKAS